MKRNVGTLDTIARLVIAVVIGVLYLMDILTGTTAIIFGIIALLLTVTALIGFCPAYFALKINTLKKKAE